MNDVVNHIDCDELVQLTQALIRIPSVYCPERSGNEERVALFVAGWLEDVGIKTVVQEVEPGRPNVIAALKGRKPGKTLMFEAHSDVVTAGDEAEWTFPPFVGAIKHGRIYGRGACDTQGNLAAALIALKAIKSSNARFNGKIILGVPVDEEGMMIGIKHFIEQGWADEVDGAIICEPEENQVCISQKGALRVSIETCGVMSHGAMPLSGFNPVRPMAEIIQRIAQLERNEIERLGKDPFLGFPSLTPTVVQAPVSGEAQLNVMASRCRLLLDVRTVPGQDHETLKKQLAKIVKDVEANTQGSLSKGFDRDLRERLQPGLADQLKFSARLNVFEDRPWTQTDKDDPLVHAVAAAVAKITGKVPVYNGVPGATDGTFLFSEKSIPIVTTGAGDRMVPHHKDEWVDIEQLLQTAQIYALSALKFLNS